MAFRLVYYALPALVAVVLMRRPLKSCDSPAAKCRRPTQALLRDAPRAELGVCRQNDARLLDTGSAPLAVIETAQTMCALFDPVSGDLAAALPVFGQYARDRNLLACLYKTTPRHAVRARAAGWYPLHIADEAVICPQTFDLSHRACRQLRRKLRQAEKAGVTVTCPETLPLSELSRIDAEWQARRGTARGLSMGRFCPDHLRAQTVYVAWQDRRVVGFASFHACANEMCLDLMRWSEGVANGTMHALIAQAITVAREIDVPRLSLAALPPSGMHAPARVMSRTLGSGLSQFKLAFAPRRQPLYALAPSRLVLGVALADIALTIRAPDRTRIHNDDEEIAFARAPQS